MPGNEEAIRTFLKYNQASFPGHQEELEWVIAEGDFVAWLTWDNVAALTQLGLMPGGDE